MDFFICCSHPWFKEKSSSKMQWAWIPKCLPTFYFIFFERESFSFFYKGFLFLIFIVHQIFIILAKLKQGQDKTARKKRHFHIILIFNFWKLKSASFDSCANFYYLKRFRAVPYLQRTWGLFPTNLKSFLHGFVQKDMHPKVYGSITQKFINQKFDTMSHFA